MLDWERLNRECVAFIQRLIQTPSMSYEEAALARLIASEWRALGFDEVWLDEMGNLFGRVYGQDRNLPMLVFNTHLDHVDPGDAALWPAPPYAAEIRDGRIIGRGAVDIKGPLGVQVYSLVGLLRQRERPRRDVLISAVVQEEIGGAGASFWASRVDESPGLIVLGEPSGNQVATGHRGIRPIWLTFRGRSAHASVPHHAINPNYALGAFLQRLEQQQNRLGVHPRLGPTTVCPTVVEVDTRSHNVSPAWTRIYLDFRTAAESINSLAAFIHELAAGFPHDLSDPLDDDEGPLPDSDTIINGFDTDPAHPAVQRAIALLAEGMGRTPELTHYQFATDGRHMTHLGAPILGYAPGEEREAHTAGESIALTQIEEALRGHIALMRSF